MKVSDFDFNLPEELIAQQPLTERSASRLLYLNPNKNPIEIQHLEFKSVLDFLRPNDILILNDTRVIKARLFGQKASGGKIEILIEHIVNQRQAWCAIKASHAPKAKSSLFVNDYEFTMLEKKDDRYLIELKSEKTLFECLEECGHLPLPPYIRRDADSHDDERYQTVFSDKAKQGAIAAPTAGLHFDETLLNQVKAKGIDIATVTLHVGSGTFQPVRVEHIADHQMHKEWFQVSEETVQKIHRAKQNGGRVIAVGTTSLRSLESSDFIDHIIQPTEKFTQLFITPSYQFKIVDALITNFHLPKSTLFMLVSALCGIDEIKTAYQQAIDLKYRFFSYGDALFLERKSYT